MSIIKNDAHLFFYENCIADYANAVMCLHIDCAHFFSFLKRTRIGLYYQYFIGTVSALLVACCTRALKHVLALPVIVKIAQSCRSVFGALAGALCPHRRKVAPPQPHRVYRL